MDKLWTDADDFSQGRKENSLKVTQRAPLSLRDSLCKLFSGKKVSFNNLENTTNSHEGFSPASLAVKHFMTHVDWFLVPCWGESGGFYSVLDMGKGSLLGCTSWSSQSKVIWGWVCVVLSAPHRSHERYSAKRRSYPCSGPVSISNPGRQNSRCWGTWQEITRLACCSWEKLAVTHQPTFSCRVFLHARAAQRWAMPACVLVSKEGVINFFIGKSRVLMQTSGPSFASS